MIHTFTLKNGKEILYLPHMTDNLQKTLQDKVTKTLRHHFLNLILKLYKNNSDKFEHCTSNK